MPDRIQKFLRSLSPRLRQDIERLVTLIARGEVSGLDVKKLQGRGDVYRVRKGNIRIIYRLTSGEVMIIAVERRSDTTYR